jgi:hypothetical protein
VLLVQHLFRALRYPLGRDRPGELGVGTKGALEYFQRKYGLNPDGYPNAATLALMAAVQSSQHASRRPSPIELVPTVIAPGARVGSPSLARPKDLVVRLLGPHVPFLAVGLVSAVVLALLALAARTGRLDDPEGHDLRWVRR